MPNAMAPALKTEQYKKLIQTKCPDVMKTVDGQVFASILISISERVDKLEKTNDWLVNSVQAMAKVLQAITVGDGGDEETEETVEGEPGMTGAATGTAGGGGGGSVKAPQRDERYNQPFPAGVPASKAEADAKAQAAGAASAAGAANAPKTGPIDDVGADDFAPNVQGTPAVNAQPIPKNPNGKGANA